MKKNLVVAAIVAMVGVGGFLGYRSITHTNIVESDLILANAEALSDGEIPDKCKGCATNYTGDYCCTIIISGTSFKLYRPGTLL